MNCFGNERKAAAQNVKTPMPHVENTAVVTANDPESEMGKRRNNDKTYNAREWR